MKIGVGAPLTGLAAQLGREMMQTVQLAVEEANAGGGIQGLELELRVVDDEGNEEGGRRTALALSEDAAVLAVVGRYNSNVTLAAAPIYFEAGVPLIAPIVSNPKLTLVVGVAPCQCFSAGVNQTTSPGRISSIGPPSG